MCLPGWRGNRACYPLGIMQRKINSALGFHQWGRPQLTAYFHQIKCLGWALCCPRRIQIWEREERDVITAAGRPPASQDRNFQQRMENSNEGFSLSGLGLCFCCCCEWKQKPYSWLMMLDLFLDHALRQELWNESSVEMNALFWWKWEQI